MQRRPLFRECRALGRAGNPRAETASQGWVLGEFQSLRIRRLRWRVQGIRTATNRAPRVLVCLALASQAVLLLARRRQGSKGAPEQKSLVACSPPRFPVGSRVSNRDEGLPRVELPVARVSARGLPVWLPFMKCGASRCLTSRSLSTSGNLCLMPGSRQIATPRTKAAREHRVPLGSAVIPHLVLAAAWEDQHQAGPVRNRHAQDAAFPSSLQTLAMARSTDTVRPTVANGAFREYIAKQC